MSEPITYENNSSNFRFLETVEIDMKKGIFKINGDDLPANCSGFTLEVKGSNVNFSFTNDYYSRQSNN